MGVTDRSRRRLLRATVAAAGIGLTGCLGGPASDGGSTTGTESATQTTADDGGTEPPGGTVHGDPYPVRLRVQARAVEPDAVPIEDAPSLDEADLGPSDRSMLRDVIERGETEPWSGMSDEVPPERIRDLIAVVARLPPSRDEIEPAEAWRVSRGETAYVRVDGQHYRVEMIKVAP